MITSIRRVRLGGLSEVGAYGTWVDCSGYSSHGVHISLESNHTSIASDKNLHCFLIIDTVGLVVFEHTVCVRSEMVETTLPLFFKANCPHLALLSTRILTTTPNGVVVNGYRHKQGIMCVGGRVSGNTAMVDDWAQQTIHEVMAETILNTLESHCQSRLVDYCASWMNNHPTLGKLFGLSDEAGIAMLSNISDIMDHFACAINPQHISVDDLVYLIEDAVMQPTLHPFDSLSSVALSRDNGTIYASDILNMISPTAHIEPIIKTELCGESVSSEIGEISRQLVDCVLDTPYSVLDIQFGEQLPTPKVITAKNYHGPHNDIGTTMNMVGRGQFTAIGTKPLRTGVDTLIKSFIGQLSVNGYCLSGHIIKTPDDHILIELTDGTQFKFHRIERILDTVVLVPENVATLITSNDQIINRWATLHEYPPSHHMGSDMLLSTRI